ncbi:MAG: transposase [Rhodobacterales bacterium]
MTQNTRFVGIDVGKFEFCVYRADLEQPFSRPNTKAVHAELAQRLGDPAGQTIALEHTGGCEWALWEALEYAGFDVRQVSAAHVRNFARSLGNLAKTDPLDARMIARFMAFRPDAGWQFPPKIVCELNVLTTKRRQFVACKKKLTCQMKQRGSQAVKELDEAHFALLIDQITALETRIETVLQSDETLHQRAKILRSIPGVGPVLTAALIGQMPELGTLNEKQAAALVGLAPINCDSGKHTGKRRIKGGRTWLRHLLYQAALVASNHNPALRPFAQRLKEKGKPHKLVLIAVARKIIIIANALVAKNVVWRAM